MYRIETVSAFFGRTKQMLASATKIVIIDGFPRSLQVLENEIAEAVARGIEVRVEAFGPFEAEGADVTVVDHPDESLAAWRSEQLNIVVDGREVLLALLDRDLTTVDQAIWSGSPYLSCLLHAGTYRRNSPSSKSVWRHHGVVQGRSWLPWP